MLFAHRSNSIERINHLYSCAVNCHEIDVQPTKDGHIVVYHDDISDKTFQELPNDTLLLQAFLDLVPSDIHLNIEVKKYPQSLGISERVLDICKKHPDLKYSFSSFDYAVFAFFDGQGHDAWFLQDETESYDSSVASTCVDKSMLYKVDFNNHARVLVYNVLYTDIEHMQAAYPLVYGWIVDYPE